MKHFFSALLLLALVTFSPQDAKPQQLDEIEKTSIASSEPCSTGWM